MALKEILEDIDSAHYAQEIANRSKYGDCCTISVVKRGHSRMKLEKDPKNITEEELNFCGKFDFQVNKTCFLSDHNIFNLTPTNDNAHHPLLVHLTLIA